ncbi:hypothetical protein DL98DRAFT_619677 [Cadophora sp. DSE1049]|nr:hypothetical protein DL98DRAFT_619677 [Cadophora sp. DSE1049]
MASSRMIHSSGIHHNLPTFPAHDGKKYSAIVTGANGISGSEIVNALVAAPERWDIIYAMSRRPPPSHNARVKGIAADFLSSSPENLATLFRKEGVKAVMVEYGTPEEDDSQYSVVTMPRNPPPSGFGKPGLVRVTFTFEGWAKRDEVKAAWKNIQEREGLRGDLDPWRRKETLVNVFGTLDAEMLGSWSRTQTMDKAKKMGCTGHVQTDEGLRKTIERMAELEMVPAL